MVRRKQRSKNRITAMGLLLSFMLIAAAGGAIALGDTGAQSPPAEPRAEVDEVRENVAPPASGSETAKSRAEVGETAAPDANARAPRRAKTTKAGNRRL